MQDLSSFLGRIALRQTPALVVRRAALMANLAVMQAACNAAGVRLRAHGKMHKCSTLARAQVAAGAIGVCCQTVGEAEIYVAAGITDVMVTAPVPPWGWARLAALAQSGATVAAVVDSAAQLAGATAVEADLTLFVDIDLGQHRAGIPPAQAPALAAAIAGEPGLRFGGVQAYAGHLQHVAGPARASADAAATARLAAVVMALRTAGLAPDQVTGGGTGTFSFDLTGGIFTELQAGSYALMDVEYGDCGGPEGAWPFQPALFIGATVVSARHRAMVTCDAGLKAVHSDGPPPRVVAGAAQGSRWRSMGDEHGAILHPAYLPRMKAAADASAEVEAIDAEDAAAPAAPPEGAIVWLQPGHVDPTVALHDAFIVADEEGTCETWPIDARRKTP